MTAESPSLDLEGLGRRLSAGLALHPRRAFVAVIHTPSELVKATLELTTQRIAASATHSVDVVTERVALDDAAKARIATLNAQRDVLLATVAGVVLIVTTEAEARSLRRWAPDLTASPDLWARVLAAPDRKPWPLVADEIRTLMAESHAFIDLKGLVLVDAAPARRPLDEVYCPLIDLTTAASTATQSGRSPRAWLILGGPGTGKSTFLRHTALRLAQGEDPLGLGAMVPVLVPLAEYGLHREREAATPLVTWTAGWLAERGVAGAEGLVSHLGEVALLLDGLDEVRDASARRAILNEAAQLAADGRVGAVVIGARTFVVDELRDSHLRSLTVVPVEQQLSASWVRALVSRLVWRPGSSELLADRILADEDLRSLARTPLLLTFLVVLHETEGRLPERRVEVYYRLCELLADRWARTRSAGRSGRRHSRGAAMRVLGPLAWWMVERGGAPIPEAELLRQLVVIESRLGSSDVEVRARASLDLLRMDTAALAPRGDGRWEFAHLSVAEYLAATEADRDPARWQQLIADPFARVLREVVIFAIAQVSVIEGRYDRAGELVQAVLARSRGQGRYDERHVGLIAGVLEARCDLDSASVVALVDRMLALVLDRAYPRETARQVQYAAWSALAGLAPSAHRAAVRGTVEARVLAPRSWSKVLRASLVSEGLASALIEDPTRDLGLEIDGHLFSPFLGLVHHLLELYDLPIRSLLERLSGAEDPRLRLVAALISVKLGEAAGRSRDELLTDELVEPCARLLEGHYRWKTDAAPSSA